MFGIIAIHTEHIITHALNTSLTELQCQHLPCSFLAIDRSVSTTLKSRPHELLLPLGNLILLLLGCSCLQVVRPPAQTNADVCSTEMTARQVTGGLLGGG